MSVAPGITLLPTPVLVVCKVPEDGSAGSLSHRVGLSTGPSLAPELARRAGLQTGWLCASLALTRGQAALILSETMQHLLSLQPGVRNSLSLLDKKGNKVTSPARDAEPRAPRGPV